MHLTYNRRNPLGDGAGEPNDGGLSDFGRHAIGELNRLGVIVAIGTDVAYVSRNEAAQRAKIQKTSNASRATSRSAGRWEHLWPEDLYRSTPEGAQSLSWVNWPLFTVGMVQRGHSDDDIRKILGENMLRVWRA